MVEGARMRTGLDFFHTCCADKGVCEWFQCNDLHVVILTRPACTV